MNCYPFYFTGAADQFFLKNPFWSFFLRRPFKQLPCNAFFGATPGLVVWLKFDCFWHPPRPPEGGVNLVEPGQVAAKFIWEYSPFRGWGGWGRQIQKTINQSKHKSIVAIAFQIPSNTPQRSPSTSSFVKRISRIPS